MTFLWAPVSACFIRPKSNVLANSEFFWIPNDAKIVNFSSGNTSDTTSSWRPGLTPLATRNLQV